MPGRAAHTLALSFLAASAAAAQDASAAADPEWWRDSVCYEVFVRSFHDSDGDGVGDLPGLIQKLDYINDGDPEGGRDLGADCVWLMPVAQSPSYHGYDVTNHYEVNRDYGTNADFRRLVEEAHRRGIRVIVDLVLNHTSSEHPFFKAAALDRGSRFYDWYIWSPTERRMPGWEAPTWHRVPTREEYYYGLFWGGMPDANLAHPDVQAEARRIARFWLQEMGVDGFRLDAVAHFFEQDGQWRHAPAVHPWLRAYAADLRALRPDVFTVGEVWDSTGAILAYYPDQLEAYFSFEVADAILDAVRTGTGARLVAAIERLEREVPDGRWATFLRNHDQTRTLTELEGDVARAKLAATLLLTLPGVPFIYYGEELGMTGSKSAGDPRLRTPLPWARRPGLGFTGGVPWEPPHADSLTANVEAQADDPASLLNHYRGLAHLRAGDAALARGGFVPLSASASGVLAYLRRLEDRAVVVVSNLGEAGVDGLELASADDALPAGSWTATPLLGGGEAASLRVQGDGRIRGWAPVAHLAPFESRILELSHSN